MTDFLLLNRPPVGPWGRMAVVPWGLHCPETSCGLVRWFRSSGLSSGPEGQATAPGGVGGLMLTPQLPGVGEILRTGPLPDLCEEPLSSGTCGVSGHKTSPPSCSVLLLIVSIFLILGHSAAWVPL